MIWLTSLSLLLLLFSQNRATDAWTKHGSTSPWTDHAKANNFMTCLVQDIANSPVFPAQEKQDLESIVETMMSAISSVSSSSGRAQIQAMDIAFASSLAEVVIAEDVGNQQAVNTKTSALSSSVQNCFNSAYGFVNKRFITEMQDLITMLTQEANAEANEIDTDQYSSTGVAGSALAANYGTSTVGSSAAWTSRFGSSTAAAASYGSSGGSSASFGTSSSALSQSLSSALTYSLSSSAIFQSIFGAGLSSQALSQITVSASQTALAQLGLSSDQVSTYSSDIQSAILSLGYGASTTDYASAISTALASGLQSAGILNFSNVNSIASSLSSAYSQSFSAIASQYGIQTSQSAATAGSAATATTSTTTTSAATQSASQTAASAFGASSAASGSSASALSESLSSALSYSLSSSAIFQSIFGAGLSAQTLLQITVSATRSALAQLGVSYSGRLERIENALLSLGYGASTTDYANAISTALASGLQYAGILNSSNVNSIASSLSSAYSQSFTAVASQYGIQTAQSAATAGSAATTTTSTTTTSAATQSASQSAASAFGASTVGIGLSSTAFSQSPSSTLAFSTQGLTSPAAISRIQGFAQSMLQAFGPNGLQVNSLAQGLSSSYTLLVSSGLSPQEAQVEALLEAIVALVQILSSAQIGSVNLASTFSISQSLSSSVNAAFG